MYMMARKKFITKTLSVNKLVMSIINLALLFCLYVSHDKVDLCSDTCRNTLSNSAIEST